MSPGSGPKIIKDLLVWSTLLVGGKSLRGRGISWIQRGLGVTDGPGGVKGRSVAHREEPLPPAQEETGSLFLSSGFPL